MRKTFLFACVAALIVACNDNATSDKSSSDAAAADTTAKIDYAYLPANHQPDNWERGDQKNVALVLNSLKGFETGNVDQALEAFADSVHWQADGFDQTLSKEELRKMFTDAWAKMASMKINMDDYESVTSKDKKDNWVSLWYTQIGTDKTGKTDSMFYMDDAKIENGKIVLLDEKQRRFPAPAPAK